MVGREEWIPDLAIGATLDRLRDVGTPVKASVHRSAAAVSETRSRIWRCHWRVMTVPALSLLLSVVRDNCSTRRVAGGCFRRGLFLPPSLLFVFLVVIVLGLGTKIEFGS